MSAVTKIASRGRGGSSTKVLMRPSVSKRWAGISRGGRTLGCDNELAI